MDRFSVFSTARSRAGFVGVLLLGALGLSAVLAYQAADASRSHEEVALKTVKEQALFAAWEFSGTARAYVADKLLKPGVEQVVRAGGRRPGDPLRHPDTDPGMDFGKWSYGPQAAGAYFRVALETGQAEMAGPEDPGLGAWIREGLPGHLALDLGDRWDPVMADLGDGGGPVVYRTLPEGATSPELVVGFRLKPASLSVPLAYAFGGPPMLPEAITEGRGNGELFSVVLATSGGDTLWRSGEAYRSDFVATDTLGTRFAGYQVSVTVNPDVAGSLIIGGLPRSRLPLVLILLLLTVGLVAGALLQLRREAELNQLRADFVSGVSHELRTPLAQIRMFAETLLLGRVRSDEERTRSLEIIASESRRLTHQVENILLYARAERRALRARVEPTDLGALARDVAECFEPLAAKARATLAVEVAPGLGAAADPGLLRQVLLNLLDNAVKYGPAGQSVVLGGAAAAGGTVCLWVADEGPGIPPRDRSRIFDPYVRLAQHRESAVAGSGIGLSVVRQVVDSLQGSVHVEDATGGGARFVITLPAATAPAPIRAPASPRAPSAVGD
ncbi:MAG: hypothetical protein AMXMBFR53_34270 [Gemmatimonadota bacterium]